MTIPGWFEQQVQMLGTQTRVLRAAYRSVAEEPAIPSPESIPVGILQPAGTAVWTGPRSGWARWAPGAWLDLLIATGEDDRMVRDMAALFARTCTVQSPTARTIAAEIHWHLGVLILFDHIT